MNKEWTFEEFKDKALKEFGYNQEDIESVDSVIILAPEKKKKGMGGDDDENYEMENKTTNTADSDDDEDREISDL